MSFRKLFPFFAIILLIGAVSVIRAMCALPTEVVEFANATEKVLSCKHANTSIEKEERSQNGEVKKYFVLSFEKKIEKAKLSAEDGSMLTLNTPQTVTFTNRVILTMKGDEVVQRTCWDAAGKFLSQTVFEKKK